MERSDVGVRGTRDPPFAEFGHLSTAPCHKGADEDMIIQNKRTRTTAIMLLSGGLLWGSGSCVPNDFLVDTWGNAVSATAAAVFEATVLNPINDTLGGDGE